MNDTPFLRRALAVATSLCLVAGMGAAIAKAGSNDAAHVGAGGAAASAHTHADDGHGHSHGPATGSSQVQAEAGTTQATIEPTKPVVGGKGSGVDLGAPRDPGPAVPPKAGTYRYHATTNGQINEQLMVVEDLARSDRQTKQAFVMQLGASKIRNDVTWSVDKAILSKSAFDYGRSNGDCDWTPDITQTVIVLSEGATWQSESRCKPYFNGVPLEMSQRSSATVKNRDRLRVADEVLDVWLIEETRQADFNGRVSDVSEKRWFSPKYGLVVKGITTTATKTGETTTTVETVSELQNLAPE